MPQSTIFDHFSPRSKMKAPEAPFSPTRTGTGIGSRTGGSQRARFEAHFKSGSPGSPSAAGGSKAAGARSKRETRLMRSSPSPEMQYDSDDDFALDRIMLTQRAEVSGRERKAKRSRRVRGSSEEADEDENEDEEESGSGDEGVPSRGAGSKRPRVVQQDESEEDEGIEVVESPSKSTSEAIGRGGRRKGRRIVVDEANDDSGAEESRNATSTTIRRSLRRPITDIPEDEGPESHQDDESVAIPPTRLTRARNSTRRSGPAAPIVDPDTAQPGPQTSHGRSKAIPQEPGAEPVRRSTRRPPALIVPEPAQTTRTARTADKTNTAAGPSVPPTQRKKGQQTSKDIPRSARSSSQVLLSVEVPPLSAVEKARYSPRFEPVSSSGREPDQGEAGEGKAGNGGDGIAVSSSSMPIEEQGDSQELVAETGVDGIDASQATGIAKRQRTGENHNEADAAPEVSDMGAPAAVRIAGRAVPGPSADRITVKQAPSKADDGEPADEGVNTLDVAESDDEIVVMEVQEKAANGSSAAAGRSSTKPVVAGNKVKTAESSRPDQSTTNNAKSASKPPPKALGAKAAKSTKRPLPRSSSSSSSSASPQPDRVRPGQKGKNAKSATRRKFKDPDASTSSSSSSSSESDVRPAKRAAAPKEPVKKSKTTNKSQQKKAKKQKKKHDPDSSDASSAVTSEEDMVAEIEMDEAERFRTETRLRCKKKETPAQRSMRKLRARRLGIIEVTSSSSTGSSDDSDDDGLVRGLSYDSGDESDYVKARSQRVNRNRAEALAEEKARRAKHAQARAVGKLPDAPLERLDEFTSDSDFIEDDGGVVPDDLLPHQFSLNSTQSPEYKFKVVFHYLLLLVMGGPKTLPLKGELKEYLMPNVHDLRRRLGGLRDGSVRSQIWRTDFVRALEKYPQFDTVELDYAEPGCDACHISTRMSTKRVQMGGYPYNKDTHEPLDSENSDSDDSDDSSHKDDPPNYLMGKFCHARARVFHSLCHWEDDLYERIKGYYHDLLRAMDRPVPDDSEASSSDSDSDSSSSDSESDASSGRGKGGKKRNSQKTSNGKRAKKGDKDGNTSDRSNGKDERRERLLARRARTAERVKRLKVGKLVKKGKERDVNEVMAWMDAKGYPKQTFMIMENLTRTATNLEHDKSRDD